MLSTGQKVPHGAVGPLDQFQRHFRFEVVLAADNVNQGLRDFLNDLVIVEVQFLKRFHAIAIVNEYGGIAAFEVQVQNGAVLFLASRVVVRVPSVLAFLVRAVDHGGHESLVCVVGVYVADEQFGLSSLAFA